MIVTIAQGYRKTQKLIVFAQSYSIYRVTPVICICKARVRGHTVIFSRSQLSILATAGTRNRECDTRCRYGPDFLCQETTSEVRVIWTHLPPKNFNWQLGLPTNQPLEFPQQPCNWRA